MSDYAFGSIDGLNATLNGDEDDVTISLNGVTILSGTWNLSGGGGNGFTALDPGATAVPHASPIFGGGGTRDVATAVSLLAGANSLDIVFTTGRPLGLADEGWDVRNLSVTGPGVDASPVGVPEPATFAQAALVAGVLSFFGRIARMRPEPQFCLGMCCGTWPSGEFGNRGSRTPCIGPHRSP